jgi:hypothetical protein
MPDSADRGQPFTLASAENSPRSFEPAKGGLTATLEVDGDKAQVLGEAGAATRELDLQAAATVDRLAANYILETFILK